MIGIWKSYYIIIRYLVLDTLMELSWAYPATKKAGHHGKLGQSESTNLGAASTATALSVAVLHADAIDFSIRHLRFLQRLGRFKTSVRSSSSFFGCLRPLSSTKTISNRPLPVGLFAVKVRWPRFPFFSGSNPPSFLQNQYSIIFWVILFPFSLETSVL